MCASQLNELLLFPSSNQTAYQFIFVTFSISKPPNSLNPQKASRTMSAHKCSTHLLLSTGATLYLKAELADVFFMCKTKDGQIERIPAHKALLAAASEVFQAMFYGELKESGDIKIVDASNVAFKEFLKFFYLTEVELTMTNVDQIMNLANKYQITVCINACARYLKDRLTNEDVCWIYGLAILFDHKQLKKLCAKFVCANAKEIFKTRNFLDCNKDVLRHILNLNLWSCTETELFEACMDWVAVTTQTFDKDQVRQVFGALFYEFRFGSMTIKEFGGLAKAYGFLFSIAEYTEIIQMIGSTEYVATLFNSQPRCNFKWNADVNFDCVRQTMLIARYHLFESADITVFSVNQPLLLGQIQCVQLHRNSNANRHVPGVLKESVELKILGRPSANNKFDVIFQGKVRLVVSCGATKITLGAPIFIKPGFMYRIEIELLKNAFRTYTVLTHDAIEIAPNTVVRFHDDSKVSRAWNNKPGLVSGLKFSRIQYEIE